MNRYERTRVLVEGSADLAQEIASEIEGVCAVEVLDEPREELVMVKVREGARGSLFYLGEALMTSCRVRVGETVGLGLLLGSNRCRAYELAVIDAAFSGPNGAALAARWDERLAQEAERVRADEAAKQRLVQRTKVDFSTMDEPGAARDGASEEGGQR